MRCECCATPPSTIPRGSRRSRQAKRLILFDNYIIARDEVGQRFVEALAAKAREGVRVRLIYDWLGSPLSRGLFAPLIAAGGEVRCFNPPRLDSPFAWLSRDHRKMIAIDGKVGFVTGRVRVQALDGQSGEGHSAVARYRRRGARSGGRRDRARVRAGVECHGAETCPKRSSRLRTESPPLETSA